MKKFLLIITLILVTLSSANAGNYPDKMYIKGAWDGSKWEWHTMTTVADGIYTYEAVWNDLYGCNINTSKSDTNSSWHKYNTIVGYDESIKGQNVVLTYSAACATLYVAPRDASSVVLMMSAPELYVGALINLTTWCRNISSPKLQFTVTDPAGNVEDLGSSDPCYFTAQAEGSYTFTVTATPAQGNVGQAQASCSLTRQATVYVGPVPCPFTPSARDKQLGYHEDTNTHDITFIFDPATWSKNYSSLTSVHVSGSFNGWSASGNDDFKLLQDPDRKLFYLTVPYNAVKRPGNIGQPEFKFVINGSYSDPYSGYPSDYVYNSNGNRNMMVVFTFDNIADIRQTIEDAQKIKQLSDFDITTRDGQEEISNYRTVPGTPMLKRCYHPFKSTSRSDMTTEPVRLELVNTLAEIDGVMADICLSEDETQNLTSFTYSGKTYNEAIPARYQAMIDAGNVIYVGKGYKTPSYNEVYYNIRGNYFGRWIQDIVAFILSEDRPGPFTIHCRLGSDRTGVFCATLAALCDTPWEDIVIDYQKTNRMGINEFRSYKLLKYTFEDLLGASDLSEVSDFNGGVKQHFINNGYLTEAQIAALKAKLVGGSSALEFTTGDDNAPVEWYSLQGVRVVNPDKGLFIKKQGSHVEKVVR